MRSRYNHAGTEGWPTMDFNDHHPAHIATYIGEHKCDKLHVVFAQRKWAVGSTEGRAEISAEVFTCLSWPTGSRVGIQASRRKQRLSRQPFGTMDRTPYLSLCDWLWSTIWLKMSKRESWLPQPHHPTPTPSIHTDLFTSCTDRSSWLWPIRHGQRLVGSEKEFLGRTNLRWQLKSKTSHHS